jgi:hypothetical protein
MLIGVLIRCGAHSCRVHGYHTPHNEGKGLGGSIDNKVCYIQTI